MNIRRKMLAVAGGTAMVVVGLMSPALAEGSFQSYMSNWGVGKESRTWQDNNTDSTNGYAQFRKCREVPAYDFKIGVYKEDSGPDTQMALKWVDCVNQSAAPPGGWPRIYFGDVPKDQYHFTLKDVHTVGQRIDVDLVNVSY